MLFASAFDFNRYFKPLPFNSFWYILLDPIQNCFISLITDKYIKNEKSACKLKANLNLSKSDCLSSSFLPVLKVFWNTTIPKIQILGKRWKKLIIVDQPIRRILQPLSIRKYIDPYTPSFHQTSTTIFVIQYKENTLLL